jgi:uncharacterized membrane protein
LARFWHVPEDMKHLQTKLNPSPILHLGAVFLAIILATALTGCENVDDRTARNTGIGAASGAVLGGVIGHQSGETAEGAALGAAVGGAGGYGYSKATEDDEEDDD